MTLAPVTRAALSFMAGAALLVGCGSDPDVGSPEQVRQEAETRDRSTEPKLVGVPDLIGADDAAAVERVEGKGLRLTLKRKFDDAKKGTVIKQSPEGGSQVRPGTHVTVTVSKGPEAPPPPAGPSGALTATAVGSVQVGMDAADVTARFGQPERKEQVNLGQGPAPQINWVWSYPDGELVLNFETERGTFTGYVCSTANFATPSGFKVGGSFAALRQRYADQITESPIGGPDKNGDGAWLLAEGEPGTRPAFTFDVLDGVITSISGGEFQAAGE
jgi:hypothetical protein